jgi:hypothetical protein
MTKGLSFAVPYDPQSMFVIIITIIIKNWSCKEGERERTFLELLLKDEDDGDGGVANQCYFLPLYFCFSFTSPLFLFFSACFLSLFFYFFISLVPFVSLCSCSSWPLSVLSVFVHFSSVFFCIICLWFSPSLCLLSVLPGFSRFVFGWLNQQPTVRGSWSSLLLEEGHKSPCLLSVSVFLPPLFLRLCVL